MAGLTRPVSLAHLLLALLAAAASGGAALSQPLPPLPRIQAFAAVAPEARTTRVGGPPVTYFASLVNGTGAPLTRCFPTAASWPAGMTYQTTNAQNQLTGSPNTPADLPAGGVQGFLIAVPAAATAGSQRTTPEFHCQQGLSTLVPSISATTTTTATASADIIAVGVTASGDGVARTTAGGVAFLAASAINIGAGGAMDVVATGGDQLPTPGQFTVCETNPQTGQCLGFSPQASVRTNFAAGETKTFTAFLQVPPGTGVPFWPDLLRVRLVFTAVNGGHRAAETSAAVATPAPSGASIGPGLWAAWFEQSDGQAAAAIFGQWANGRMLFLGGPGLWGAPTAGWVLSLNGAFSGTAYSAPPGNLMFTSGAPSTSPLTGTISPRFSFEGAFGPGGPGARSGRFRSVFDGATTDFQTSAAALAGDYDILAGTTDIGEMTISASGSWTGRFSVSGSTNCQWSGPFAQESGRNFFTATMAFQQAASACAASFNGRTWSGWVSQAGLTSTGQPSLIGVVTDEAGPTPVGGPFVFNRKTTVRR